MASSKPLAEAIKRTIRYSDLFSFPLTQEEIWQFLLYGRKITQSEFQEVFDDTTQPFKNKDKYYAYSEATRANIANRAIWKKYSKQKIAFARQIIPILAIIPSLRFIGISGGVAAESADPQDDIDLFIVTQHDRIWLTRLVVLLFLQLFGVRRRRGKSQVQDAMCTNMFLDEDALTFPHERQDIYTVHELCFLIPLLSRNNTYQRLFSSNTWGKRLMYNAFTNKAMEHFPQTQYSFLSQIIDTIFFRVNFFESCAKWIQLLLIRRHRTTETITDTLLAFHPHDYREEVLESMHG